MLFGEISLISIQNSTSILEHFELRLVENLLKNTWNSLLTIRNCRSNTSISLAFFVKNTADYILFFSNISATISFSSVIFSQNTVNSQVLSLEWVYSLFIDSLLCEGNNLATAKEGGCMRTKNVFSRRISNLRIIRCFSSQTTSGLIIIDTNLNELIKEFSIFTQEPSVEFS